MGNHSNREDLSLVMTSYFDPKHTGALALPTEGEGRHRWAEPDSDDEPTVRIPRHRPAETTGRHRRKPAPGRRQDALKGVLGVGSIVSAALVVGLVLNHAPVVDDPGMAADILSAPASTSASATSVSPTHLDFLSATSKADEPAPPAMTTQQPAPVLPVPTTTTEKPAPPPATSDTPAFCNTAATCQAYSEVIVPPSQLGCFQEVVFRESSWNIYAEGPLTDNGRAYGLGQALPRSKYASAGTDWATNGATQLRWTLIYMNDRYGSPCAALEFHDRMGWY